MAAPPYLCSRRYGGTSPQVYRALNGKTLSQVGNNFGTLEDLGAVVFPCNSVVEFGGDLYCWQWNTIYKYNSGTGNWDSDYAVPSYDTGDDERRTGLYIINVSGTPTLIGLHRRSAGNIWDVRLPLGGSWSNNNTGIDEIGGDLFRMGYIGGCFVWRDLFWMVGSQNPPKVMSWDPANSVAVVHTLPGTSGSTCGGTASTFVILNNDLYVIGARTINNAEDYITLWRFQSGAFVAVQNIGSTVVGTGLLRGNGSNPNRDHYAAWSDGTNIFCIVRGASTSVSTGGLYAFKLAPSGSTFTETNITNPVVPSAYRQGSMQATDYPRWWVVKDNDTDPTSPDVYFYFSLNYGSAAVLHYVWEGESTLMSDGTSLGSGELSMPDANQTAGERAWTSSEPNVLITGLAQGTGGLTISFKAWGGGTKTVKFYYSLEEETPTSQCTLTGSATGGSATRSGNTVTNVSADGATTYTITWDFFTDGAFIGGRFEVLSYIE